MNAAIVDTDVVSMLFKGDTRALAYSAHMMGRLLGISFMTLAELERWPLRRDWGLRRKLDLGVRFRQPMLGLQRAPSTIRSLSLPTIAQIIRRLKGLVLLSA